ncbi:MAG: hypothetical protein ACREND_05570 [Gemmatimonadaceae bacterium]
MTVPVAAIILHKEKIAVEAFRRADAVSPDHAISLAEVGASEGLAFRKLRARAVLRETTPGRYYLDEPTWAAMRRLRHRLAIAAIAILLGLVFIGVITLRPS